MPDDFLSLSNRLLNQCPAAGIILAQQFINDSWRALQARRAWSWRRNWFTVAPPNIYQTGSASTNVGIGQPTLITGIGTSWTPQMVGTQIRIGCQTNPYYTIIGYVSPTGLLIDQPWAGPDVVSQVYQVLQIYYPFPQDFGYFVCMVSLQDGYQIWTNITQTDLALLDPQRSNTGQTYTACYRDTTPQYGGVIGPVIPVSAAGAAPISTTTTGYTYVANASYIIKVIVGGASATATFSWMRSGQTSFTGPVPTSTFAVNLMDGVQVYWPANQTYDAGDLFVINATAQTTVGVPRYELWPGPTISTYLYTVLYTKKEYDLTTSAPTLPPLIAQRGDVLLEMGLEKCAMYPGSDADHPNIYFNPTLARMHAAKVADMLIDLERNDEEVGVTNIEYQKYPFYPAPWLDGCWQQSHAPFLNG